MVAPRQDEPEEVSFEPLSGALRPLVETLAVMSVVSILVWIAAVVGLSPAVALDRTVLSRPWTLVTSVYVHAGLVHLVGNAVVVVLAGVPIAVSTTRARFHAFFLGTGALAGLAQVAVTPAGVVGASGAAFALAGYVATSNPVSGTLLDWTGLAARVTVPVAAVVVGIVTVLASPAGSAVVAHFAGGLLGVVAGRFRVLRVG